MALFLQSTRLAGGLRCCAIFCYHGEIFVVSVLIVISYRYRSTTRIHISSRYIIHYLCIRRQYLLKSQTDFDICSAAECLFFATQNTVIVFDATILTYLYCGFRLICNDSRGITIIAVIQFITIVHYNINVSHHAAAALHPVFHSKYLHTMQ